ncbi:hypothetical protein POM88_000719 [Heracleum sosnowskyi]|uniref:NB-ARC domain-containing protein n=1 Tax=Heracleum sosnowskyi TaxID=360622 RepID=A0AAD8JCR2_9APIA|nr:hypothetical protein POM88_000719 [Heracleum sosnowskyi]
MSELEAISGQLLTKDKLETIIRRSLHIDELEAIICSSFTEDEYEAIIRRSLTRDKLEAIICSSFTEDEYEVIIRRSLTEDEYGAIIRRSLPREKLEAIIRCSVTEDEYEAIIRRSLPRAISRCSLPRDKYEAIMGLTLTEDEYEAIISLVLTLTKDEYERIISHSCQGTLFVSSSRQSIDKVFDRLRRQVNRLFTNPDWLPIQRSQISFYSQQLSYLHSTLRFLKCSCHEYYAFELLSDPTLNILVGRILDCNQPPDFNLVGDRLAFEVAVVYEPCKQDFGRSSQHFASLFHFDDEKFQEHYEREVFVGFQVEANSLLKQLASISKKKLEIISIVGMAGLGKTTLAQRLYNDPYLVSYFYVRAWVTCSRVYQKRNLLLAILRSVSEVTDEVCRMHDSVLVQNLYRALKGRRYLILRYLEIRFTVGSPPESVSQLRELQTLIMSSKMNMVIPKNMWKMINLRHLCIKSGDNLVNFSNVEKEPSFLENLQTMSLVSPSSPCQQILAKTRNLKKLGLCGPLATETGDLKCPNLGLLMHLETLKLLNTVPLHKAGRLSDSCTFPENLKSLSIANTYLEWKEDWIFEKMPNLEVLKLKLHAFSGSDWETRSKAFPRLKFLKLEELDIMTWTATRNHFPVLRHLQVYRCSYLMEIPEDFGNICTLEAIELDECSDAAANSARDLQKEQESYGNDCLKIFLKPGSTPSQTDAQKGGMLHTLRRYNERLESTMPEEEHEAQEEEVQDEECQKVQIEDLKSEYIKILGNALGGLDLEELQQLELLSKNIVC